MNYEESMQMKILEKLTLGIKSPTSEGEEEEKKSPREDDADDLFQQKQVFEKVVAKLLEYNDRINQGKEISVVEYFKKLD